MGQLASPAVPTPLPPDYEASASYVDAMLRALGRQALANVTDVMDPAALEMVRNVYGEPWHPARHLEAFGAAMVQARGPEAFEDLTYRAMKDRFGAIVLPMLKRSLDKTGRSPDAILNNLAGVIEVGLRNIDLKWRLFDDKKSGNLYITYPRPVAAHVDHSWRGMFRFVFEETQASGRVVAFDHSPDGRILTYRLEW